MKKRYQCTLFALGFASVSTVLAQSAAPNAFVLPSPPQYPSITPTLPAPTAPASANPPKPPQLQPQARDGVPVLTRAPIVVIQAPQMIATPQPIQSSASIEPSNMIAGAVNQHPVYVAPAYPSPGEGWLWQYDPKFDWGWYHPKLGWYRLQR